MENDMEKGIVQEDATVVKSIAQRREDMEVALNLEEMEYPLPVGWKDDKGVIYNVVKMQYMNGEVEERITDKKNMEVIGKFITELVSGVAEYVRTADGTKKRRVSKQVALEMCSADRDAVLVYNRHLSIGEVLKQTVSCPECKAKLDVNTKVLDLAMDMCLSEEDVNKRIHVELPQGIVYGGELRKSVYVKRVDGAGQERVSAIQDNAGKVATALVSSILASMDGVEVIPTTMYSQLTSKDRRAITSALEGFRGQISTSVDETCASCGNSFKVNIPFELFVGE